MKFEEKLMTLRKVKGWSQEDLSNKIGVSRQTISKWESSQTVPDMKKLIELSNLFEISIDELINENEKKLEEKDEKKVYTKVNLKLTNILIIIACILIILGLIISIIISVKNKNNMFVNDIVMITYDYTMNDNIEVLEIYSFSNSECVGINRKMIFNSQEDYESIIKDINKNRNNERVGYNIILDNLEIIWSIKPNDNKSKNEILESKKTSLRNVQNLKITDM